jgi:N-acetylglucosamine-6-sulfatase
MRRRAFGWILLFGCIAAVMVGPSPARAASAVGGPAAVATPRNVVVLMMDDMTLQELPYLPKVNQLLKAKGTSFTNYVVNTPECCPSRATLLTGQYTHNHQVLSGVLPTGGYTMLDHTNTLPVWLHDAGYYTAVVGKYMNGIQQADLPPGWSDYYGLFEPTNYNYWNFDTNHNGTIEHHGTAETDYQTDVLGRHAVDVINSRASSTQPFFLYFAPIGPHAGTVAGTGMNYAVAAPRYDGAALSLARPVTPDFNEADVSDKPSFVRSAPFLTASNAANDTRYWQQSIETMLAEDEWIGKIVDTLSATGKLANTDIFFTSDNGLFLGEHRLQLSKVWSYEVDIHLPLIAVGPDFPVGATVGQATVSADLAPTIVDLAQASSFVRRTMDGTSLLPFAANPNSSINRWVLVELGPAWGRVTYTTVRGPRWKYTEYSTGEKELYDLYADPYELVNRAADPSVAWIQTALADRLAVLRTCSGVTCRMGL